MPWRDRGDAGRALDPGDPIVFAPAICRAVGAADKQSVEHGKKNRPLQPKAVLARAAELLNHGPAAGLLPQPLEHQRRPDAAAGDLHSAVVRDGREHQRLAGEARARSQQPLQLPAFLQLLVPSKRNDHLLAHLIAVAAALDDLQIGAPG